MSDIITINIQQKKGSPNSVRLFFNYNLLDEFDTKESAEVKNYEVDIIDGDINSFYIEVLNQKTIVEDNNKNHILSSNSVIINDMKTYYKKHDAVYSNKYPIFKRKIDPIYQIYAKQNNLDYKTFNIHCDVSIGNGYFAWFLIPLHQFRFGYKNPEERGYCNIMHWNTIERELYWGWDEENNTEIFKERVFKDGKKTLSDQQIVDVLRQFYTEKFLCDNISEHIDINIVKMCEFYED